MRSVLAENTIEDGSEISFSEYIGKKIKEAASLREKLIRGMRDAHEEDWPEVVSAYERVVQHFHKKRFVPVTCPVVLVRTSRRDVWKKLRSLSSFGIAGFVTSGFDNFHKYEYRLHVLEDWKALGFSAEAIVAHEMVHVEQASRGDLELDGYSVTWKGVPSRSWFSTDYKNLPWEKEAFERMDEIAKDCTSVSQSPDSHHGRKHNRMGGRNQPGHRREIASPNSSSPTKGR